MRIVYPEAPVTAVAQCVLRIAFFGRLCARPSSLEPCYKKERAWRARARPHRREVRGRDEARALREADHPRDVGGFEAGAVDLLHEWASLARGKTPEGDPTPPPSNPPSTELPSFLLRKDRATDPEESVAFEV